MEMYEDFALVYDRFMDETPYEEWCQFVVGRLKQDQITDGILLDLGCGTGSMTELLAKQGYDVTVVAPRADGTLDIAAMLERVDKNTILVACMMVNNEIGTRNDVEHLAAEVKRRNSRTIVHVDAVQAWMRVPIKLDNIDTLAVSGHKIHAPKGIGALYVKKGSRLRPVSFGGGQEKNIRPGTEGIANLCAMGLSAQLLTAESAENHSRVTLIRDALLEGLTKLPDICINSPADATPYILNFSALGVRSEIMLHFLEEKGIYVSSGSACAKGGASHVLQAMGLERERADSAIRLSFGRYNTPEQVPLFLEALEEGLKRFRR